MCSWFNIGVGTRFLNNHGGELMSWLEMSVVLLIHHVPMQADSSLSRQLT